MAKVRVAKKAKKRVARSKQRRSGGHHEVPPERLSPLLVPDGLLTVRDVCALLRLRPLTIYRYCKAKKLRAYTFGRNLRFRRRDVEAFLERHKA